jgi:hypothetical protein
MASVATQPLRASRRRNSRWLFSAQWEDFRCPAGCGVIQYRHRTRTLRRQAPRGLRRLKHGAQAELARIQGQGRQTGCASRSRREFGATLDRRAQEPQPPRCVRHRGEERDARQFQPSPLRFAIGSGSGLEAQGLTRAVDTPAAPRLECHSPEPSRRARTRVLPLAESSPSAPDLDRLSASVLVTCPRCGHVDRMLASTYALWTDGILCGLCGPPYVKMRVRIVDDSG